VRRTILAFAIAPLWVPLLVIAAILLFDPYVKYDGGPAPAGVVSTVITYAGILLIGLPAFLFLRSRGWTSWWLSVALGFAAGVAMFAVFLIAFGSLLGESLHDQWNALPHNPFLTNAATCLVTGGLGALVGITLWLIARPDRR